MGVSDGTFYPGTGTDDGYGNPPSTFVNSQVYGLIGTNRHAFVRFQNVTIPQDAWIQSAFVRFTAYLSDATGAVTATLDFADADNPAAPTNYSELEGLTRTGEGVDWTLGAWVLDQTYDSQDVTDSLQVIVNRSGWNSGQSVIFLADDNGSSADRYWDSYEATGSDYAQLHATWITDVHIDWGSKIIFVPKCYLTLIQASPTVIYEMDLNDFRMKLKDLEDDEEGMPHLDTHRHNTEVTIQGINFARVIEIINGYTITFEDGQYAVNLVGANSNIGDVVNVNQVSIRSNNSAGLISSPDIEYSSFNGGVIVDVNSGISGTLYPRGTIRMPVDNIADAVLIAEYRGFNKIYFHSDFTLGSESTLDSYILEGISRVQTDLVIGSAASVVNAIVRDCIVSGVLDGNNSVENCCVSDLTYFHGHISNSGLHGTIALQGSNDAYIVNCSQADVDAIPVIDMGGSGQDVVIPDYSGAIRIENLTGSNKVFIGLDAGRVILDSSTVTSGEIRVSGVGLLVDESGTEITTGTWNGGVTIVNTLAGQSVTVVIGQ